MTPHSHFSTGSEYQNIPIPQLIYIQLAIFKYFKSWHSFPDLNEVKKSIVVLHKKETWKKLNQSLPGV